MQRALVGCALFVALTGCRRGSAPSDTTAVASTSASVSAFASSAPITSDSAAPAARPPPKIYPACQVKPGEDVDKRAADALNTHAYDLAVACFLAGGDSSRRRAQAGYAKILAGDPIGALETLDSADADLGAPAMLRGQIAFNRGLAYDALGNQELARVSYARSLALSPTDAARSKLAGRSTCVATVTRGVIPVGRRSNDDTVYTTRSWRDIHSTLDFNDHAKETEAYARDAVCGGDASDLCTGALWNASTSAGARSHDITIRPLADQRYLVVDRTFSGGGCTGGGAIPSLTESASLVGDVVAVDSVLEEYTGQDRACHLARTTHVTDFHDPIHAHTVRIDGASAKLVGRTVTIHSPGCDPVPLDGVGR